MLGLPLLLLTLLLCLFTFHWLALGSLLAPCTFLTPSASPHLLERSNAPVVRFRAKKSATIRAELQHKEKGPFMMGLKHTTL